MPSELDIEITTTESFLAEFKVRPGRRTVDHARARYLWCGVQTAEVINLACQAGHPAGTAPLRRYLLETVLDVYSLVSSDSLDLDVARSMVWDVIDWDRIWDHHEDAVMVDPELDTGRTQVHTFESIEIPQRDALLRQDLRKCHKAREPVRRPRESSKGKLVVMVDPQDILDPYNQSITGSHLGDEFSNNTHFRYERIGVV